jgi:DNA-binding Lrp family transcriptional regulator
MSNHAKILARLTAMLTARPMTAKQIAKAMGCSKPTAYQRVRTLEARGHRIVYHAVPSPSGPPSFAFEIV